MSDAGYGSLHGDRYAKFGRWLEAAVFVDVPVICLDENGVPSFAGGRHRFAWLRDHGLLSLPIEMPPNQAEVFGTRFGAVEQIGTVI